MLRRKTVLRLVPRRKNMSFPINFPIYVHDFLKLFPEKKKKNSENRVISFEKARKTGIGICQCEDLPRFSF